MFFISFSILSYPIGPKSIISTEYTKPCGKVSQLNLLSSYNQIIILYVSNTLPMKKLILSETLLFQSYATWLWTTLSSIQSMLNSLQNGKCSFIFTTLLVHTTNATISIKKLFLYFSQFSPPIPVLFVHKILLTIPTKISFLYTPAIFHLLFFAYNHSNNLH